MALATLFSSANSVSILPSLLSAMGPIMLWYVFKLDDDFNNEADLSPTPKTFKLNGFIVHQHYHTVLPQSADCLHHIGISVSYDDSLIFSDVACLLTTKHISYATHFALQFHISCLFPQNEHFDSPIYVI